MAQITVPERVTRIRKLLNELNKVPPEKHEVTRFTGFGDPLNCPVISIGAHELLLNHRSHRIRAQLQDDSQWEELKTDPQGEGAQDIIAFHIRQDRGEEQFSALQQSLQRDGQTNPGVITHDGVIINGNTRAVAIREFPDISRQYIRVAVLPETITLQQLNLLELRLQMQKELKGEYSFTNELLFVEELKEEWELSYEQIAAEMRIHPGSATKGANEVQLRLRMLELIRQMQNIPVQRLPLRFFDKLAYEQLKQTLREYDSRMKVDTVSAARYLESILLSGMLGVTSVHQLRRVDDTFVADYLTPHLEEDEIVGRFAEALTAPQPVGAKSPAATPAGVGKLLKQPKAKEVAGPNILELINKVNQKEKEISIVSEGKKVSLSTDSVKEALKNSLIVGINEKRGAEKTEDKLSAPVDLLKKAANELVKCYNALPVAMRDPEFNSSRKNSLEIAFKKLKKRYRELEAILAKAGVIAER